MPSRLLVAHLATDEGVVTRPAEATVETAAPVEVVVAAVAEEAIAGVSAEEPVAAAPSSQDIAAVSTAGDVCTASAEEEIPCAGPDQPVVTASSADDVAACRADERVVTGRADDIVARVAFEARAFDLLDLSGSDVEAEEAAVGARVGGVDVRIVVQVDEPIVGRVRRGREPALIGARVPEDVGSVRRVAESLSSSLRRARSGSRRRR